MRTYGAADLFAGVPETVDQALGVSKFASRRALLALNRRGIGVRATTLVPTLFEVLDRNWRLGLGLPHGRSLQNFRWHSPQCHLCEENPSREVSLNAR